MKKLQLLFAVLIICIGNSVIAQSEDDQIKKFKTIDTNNNEVVTIAEMTAYYRNETDKNGEVIDADKVFANLDVNKNDIVTLSEFLVKDMSLIASDNESITDVNSNPSTTMNKVFSTDAEKARLTKRFNQRDANANNVLNIDEFINYYKNIISKDSGKPLDGKFYFYSYDFNLDKKVTLEEFLQKPDWKLGELRLKNLRNATSEGYMKKRIILFSEVDLDHNSKVTLIELKEYYKDKTNNKGKPVNVQFKFFGYDDNSDGVLELSEFARKINLEQAKKRYKAFMQ
jgi:Ca2+-binding EF-hand superfamily protein